MPESTTIRQPSIFKNFVLPSLWIFLVPILSLAFFWHAQSRMDARFREGLLASINKDAALDEEQRANARELFNKVPGSKLARVPEFADMFTVEARQTYMQFRWLIRISFWSIVVSVLTFLGVGLCVLMSLKSQRIQYYSLLWSWYVLRLVGIFLTIAQGLLLFALTYWVPALWMNVFIPKLLFVAGFVAVVAVFLVLKAFFKRIKMEIDVSGIEIQESMAKPLWLRLRSLCTALGIQPPDHILVGIDASFFVTEQSIIANDRKLKGRSLFVSLPLLKQLNGTEADAVLAHEMAHFGGQDTLYSRKISPLLTRYENYLEALQKGGTTLPVFYFMNCFRALFEVSLKKLSREREFRADALASQLASPRDLAGALLRIMAYSKYREQVESELFLEQKVLEDADICDRIEVGFQDFSHVFASKANIGESATTHPFDSHPSTESRLAKVGITLVPSETELLLARPGDGAWYHEIERSNEIERAQWDEFEESFRKYHEQSLPYRMLPSTDHEKEIVVNAFPMLQFQDKKGIFTIDFEKVSHADWGAPIYFKEITQCENNDGSLIVRYLRDGKQKQTIKSGGFKKQASEMLASFQKYYGRYVAAAQFQTIIAKAESPSPTEGQGLN